MFTLIHTSYVSHVTHRLSAEPDVFSGIMSFPQSTKKTKQGTTTAVITTKMTIPMTTHLVNEPDEIGKSRQQTLK